MLALLALLLAVGPHALDAELHARDAEAGWVRAAPAERGFAATAPALARRVYGYLPYWQSMGTGFQWDLVSDVIAFSASLGTDGSVANPHALPAASLVSLGHAHGVRVHLCVTLFNSSGGIEIATFLASATARAHAVSQITALAAGLDGINLDFEFVPSSSRADYASFVEQLHAALAGHGELTVAMPANTGYAGYDVSRLAKATERLLLMEYDYHWKSAPTTGANAPLPPVSSAVDGFLAAGAQPAQLVLGVPYYGYEWAAAGTSPGAATQGPGTTVLFADAFAKFAQYGRLWDAASQTPWYRPAGAQGWVDDDQSLALKYQLINQKNLAGVMIWALGYDGARSEAWDALRAAFGQAAPPPPTTPGHLTLLSAAIDVDGAGLVTAVLHVRNTGGQPVGDVAPPPSVVYSEVQSFSGAVNGTFRVALDAEDRLAALPAHPWRWGPGGALAPGEERDVTVHVQLQRPGARTLFAAVVEEGVAIVQDHVAPTTLTFGDVPDSGGVAPDAGSTAPDAGADPGGAGDPHLIAAQGCSQTGTSGAALAIFFALLLARRTRR